MKTPVSHPDIKRIVSRCHVSESCLSVCRKVKRALKWKKHSKIHRRYAIAAAIQAHAENVWLYRYVQGSVPRKYPAFKPRYYFDKETSKTTIG